MNYTEQPILFPCEGETLLGILAQPQTPAQTGVVIVVGGPQYRAGSHRQFVLLSRALAAAGFPVFRFDYRGMGDSTGEARNFDDVSLDIAAAIDALQRALPSVTQVVLWGLCDGASAALLHCHETRDSRVRGLCLLNPWVRSETSLARTQVKHYYTLRLRQGEFWHKLLTGKVASGALRGLTRSVMTALSTRGAAAPDTKPSFQARMAQGWKSINRPILLLLSGNDYTAKEFLEYIRNSADWSGALGQPLVQRCDLLEADHTCSNAEWRGLVEDRVLEWLTHS